MLSYQHQFHAGNHADVIKHLVLVATLNKLCEKAKPFVYIDTHAGSGRYQLGLKNQDDVLASNMCNLAFEHSVIRDYLEVVKSGVDTKHYFGSPLIATQIAKKMATYHCAELHPSAYDALLSNNAALPRGQKLQIHKRDGFSLLQAIVPPKPNRGLVLIDPPYEHASEYEEVVKALVQVQKKWPQALLLIWYPLLSEHRINRKTNVREANPKHGLSENMIDKVKNETFQGLLNIQLRTQEPNTASGMYGSGVLMINPPWKLDIQLKEVTTELERLMNAQQSSSILYTSSVEWLREAP